MANILPVSSQVNRKKKKHKAKIKLYLLFIILALCGGETEKWGWITIVDVPELKRQWQIYSICVKFSDAFVPLTFYQLVTGTNEVANCIDVFPWNLWNRLFLIWLLSFFYFYNVAGLIFSFQGLCYLGSTAFGYKNFLGPWRFWEKGFKHTRHIKDEYRLKQ